MARQLVWVNEASLPGRELGAPNLTLNGGRIHRWVIIFIPRDRMKCDLLDNVFDHSAYQSGVT